MPSVELAESLGVPWPARLVAAPLEQLGALAPPGVDVLLVTSEGFLKRGMLDRLAQCMPDRRIRAQVATPNPDLHELEGVIRLLRGRRPHLILGLGGGSALDTAKVLALLLAPSSEQSLESLLDIRLPASIAARLPLVLIPTTAGTGSEVTPFATIWNFRSGRKYSVDSDQLVPDLALLDASLTHSLSRDTRLWAGLDTVSHALESLWNHRATAQSRECAYRALRHSIQAQPEFASTQPMNPSACAQAQQASAWAGLAIAETRTALAHSISYPLTARYGVPHGLACSFTLEPILKRNLDVLAVMPADRELLQQTLTFLRGLGLGQIVRQFATPEAVMSLSSEMHTPQRAGNYRGAELPALDDLLLEALSA